MSGHDHYALTYAVLGRPIRGSLSPVMHNAAFEALGMDARYEALDVAPGDLGSVFEKAARGHWAGFNLTHPHKTAGAALCDWMSPEAEAAGAVNTVVFDGLRAEGHNTDVVALRSVMLEWATAAASAAGQEKRFSAAVLGSGGAARAAAVAAAQSGAGEVVVSARATSKAEEAASALSWATRRFGGARRAAAEPVIWRGLRLPELLDALRRFDVVVQATSAPDRVLRFEAAQFAPGVLAVELNYRPSPSTSFLEAAAAGGARAVDGLEILLRQGEEAFRLFTGVRPPGGVMRRALSQAVGRGAGGEKGVGS
ncbi:MAG: hypothetical protein C4551_07460 [Bacillota bacterium]|nr:MAG: hypothetical protein C4551_07460 [Bacillota bacterium]